MAQTAPIGRLSIAEYLASEQRSQVKHEYAAGLVFAMAGASERHNRITLNIGSALLAASRGTPCIPFVADMRVRVDEVVYYPDVMVCRDPGDDDAYLKHAPCVVIEVLSESTERIDRGEKLYNYQRLASLRAYALVAQDLPRAEIYRRDNDGRWLYECHDGIDAGFDLPCPPTRLTLAGIYERIAFAP
ncbi:MAG: Uma2 family endonuclease [Xanthomonadales bacterium]|nr:hypothetical protein [Xanthomonadales bacterium]MCC6593031.1 Uma2 family endonuclease [Xanthomonadales bacterium]MCE7931072.1 Uma2 family endonuclease [Xanthomonadales bacterium PRO6]